MEESPKPTTDNLSTPNTDEKSQKSSLPLDFDISKISSDDMIAKAIENIKIEYEDKNLKFSTIKEIYKAITIISLPEFTRNIKWERNERRENFDNLRKYVEIWIEGTQKFEQLLIKSQNEVLKALKIDPKVWEDSSAHHMKVDFDQFVQASVSIPVSLKASLLPSKKLTIDQLKDVLKLQIKLYSNFDISSLDKIFPDRSESVNIIQNKINDLIFKSTSLEEEDIVSSAKEHGNNEEIQKLLIVIQQATLQFSENEQNDK